MAAARQRLPSGDGGGGRRRWWAAGVPLQAPGAAAATADAVQAIRGAAGVAAGAGRALPWQAVDTARGWGPAGRGLGQVRRTSGL